MFESLFYVYLLASKRNGTLYVGMTSDLTRRVWEHKQKSVKSFSQKYSVDKLVYFESYSSLEDAMQGERRLKRYRRAWKIKLIEEYGAPKILDRN